MDDFYTLETFRRISILEEIKFDIKTEGKADIFCQMKEELSMEHLKCIMSMLMNFQIPNHALISNKIINLVILKKNMPTSK